MLNHTKIAVNSICSVHEQRWSSGRVKRGNNFIGNDGAFANACYDNTAFCRINFLNTGFKVIVNKIGEIIDCPRFIY